MRALRIAPVVGVVLALCVAASAAAVPPPVQDVDQLGPMNHVTGSMALGPSEGLGVFSTNDRVWQYRDVPISGAPLITNDPRLNGTLESTWNWDIDSSGQLPVPAWGSMRIEVPPIETTDAGIPAGAWAGDFTAIRSADRQPFMVRAMLFGEGAYEGLCATLDFQAGADAWLTDGVIHQVPMAG